MEFIFCYLGKVNGKIIFKKNNFQFKDVQFNNFYHPFENTNLRPGNIALALFGGLYSYDGWDILNYGIEDVKSPRRLNKN